MLKKTAALLAALLLIFTFAGCKARPGALFTEETNTVKNIALGIYEDSITRKGLDYCIFNGTTYEVMCSGGENAGLQVQKRDGKWYSVQGNSVDINDSEVYMCTTGTTLDFSINWQYQYNSLNKGHYRLIKYVEYYDESLDNYVDICLSKEFDIK